MTTAPAPGEGTSARPQSPFLSTLVCAPAGVLGAVLVDRGLRLPLLWMDRAAGGPGLGAPVSEAWAGRVSAFSWLVLAAGVLLVAASVNGLARRGSFSLRAIRAGYAAAYALLAIHALGVLSITADAAARMVDSGEVERDAIAVWIFFERWRLLWPWLGAGLFLACAHVLSRTRAAAFLYTGERPAGPLVGDRILEDIRTHGPDPARRKSVLASAGVHLAALVLPLLLEDFGCVTPYRVPYGRGSPVVTYVQMVKPRKRKKKRFVLRPDSAIYFHVPDLEESEVLKEVDEDSRLTYQADPDAVHGKMGAGGKGPGGWPEGMGNEPVRFIRLEHGGPGWDDGMDGRTRADLNFLDHFEKVTPFKGADRSESHAIALLAKYPKGYAPPFVYMTGHGGIGASAKDVKVLRAYLLEGGMLFADCGSERFHGSFLGFVKAVFPDRPLLVIADDDPIFQMPYRFPNGAPPLWHHGGTRALGVKHRDRWVVFYHPGDINDAWKTGHSGLRADLAEGAFQMGVNIVYYSFTNYLRETRRHRK